MRIANLGFANSIKYNLSATSSRIGDLYAQASSGNRLQKLSDDPQAMVRAVQAHASLSELDARKYVAQQGQELISATDSALGEVSDALSQAKALALQGSTATVSQAERSALAEQVRALQSSLVLTGNTSVEGHYLFSGSKSDTAPLQETPTGNLPVAYLGDSQQVTYQVSADEKTAVGFSGAEVFNYTDASGNRAVSGVDEDVFSVLNDLAGALESGDTGKLDQASGQLDKLSAHTINLRGQAGVLGQRWAGALTAVDTTSVQLNQLLANEQSVDYTSAIVELSNLQTTYQAALSLTSQMLKVPNLFDLR